MMSVLNIPTNWLQLPADSGAKATAGNSMAADVADLFFLAF